MKNQKSALVRQRVLPLIDKSERGGRRRSGRAKKKDGCSPPLKRRLFFLSSRFLILARPFTISPGSSALDTQFLHSRGHLDPGAQYQASQKQNAPARIATLSSLRDKDRRTGCRPCHCRRADELGPAGPPREIGRPRDPPSRWSDHFLCFGASAAGKGRALEGAACVFFAAAAL